MTVTVPREGTPSAGSLRLLAACATDGGPATKPGPTGVDPVALECQTRIYEFVVRWPILGTV